ncbi:MAG: hypothetical protein WEB30_04080 [Cyclobacteriaceae bacterium]
MKKCFFVLCAWMWGGVAFAQDDVKVKGDPAFFPIAVWAQNPVNASAYKENGINMYISIHGGLDQEKLDHLKKAEMKVIAHQNDFGLTKLDEPLIYGWMHGDEPDNAQRNRTENKWDPCRDPAVIVADYNKIREKDPSRPVYLNVGRGVAYTNWVGRGACRGKVEMYKISNNGYLKGCDIASFDIYPVNSREEDVEGRLWYVAKGIDNLQEWSDHKKPTWCWIETTRISDKAKRKPTPAEVKSEVWMALIHGAKGFGYFCHSFVGKTDDAALLHDAEMILGVKAINEQVTSLAPVLNYPDTEGYATVNAGNGSVPVDIMTKKDGKVNYIFAVAMRDGETTATFEVKSGKTVEVLGENRTIKIKKGKFSDKFADYGVHLYRVTK